MKKGLSIILAVFLIALGIVACGGKPDESVGVAYGTLHSQYAGKATVVTGKNKNITDVIFEEHLPVSAIANQGDLIIDEAHKNGTYAKWVKVGDQVFALDAADTYYVNAKWITGDYVLTKSGAAPTGKKSVYDNPDFTKWYIGEVGKGNFWIGKNAECSQVYSDTEIPFNTYTVTTSGASSEKFKVTKNTWTNKAINGYWTIATVSDIANGTLTNVGPQTQLGWKLNMAAMKEAILAHGFSAYTGSETTPAAGDTWKIGNNTTGATLMDYHQYMGLAKKAYDSI